MVELHFGPASDINPLETRKVGDSIFTYALAPEMGVKCSLGDGSSFIESIDGVNGCDLSSDILATGLVGGGAACLGGVLEGSGDFLDEFFEEVGHSSLVN